MSIAFFRNLMKPNLPAWEERKHRVAGRVLPLKIVQHNRARNLTLRIEAGGRELRMTVPPGVSRREVEGFLVSHQGWLERRLEKAPVYPAVRPGIKIPLRGVPHLIVHEPDKRGTVEAKRDRRGEPVLVVYGERRYLARRVADFLKREAKRDIERLVAKHTAALGRTAKSIRFRDTTSRWGSCSADGNLSFSWRIMMAPPPVINYLVAHEVAHLKEMNHGPKFWKLCTELCPGTERCKDWLTRNGGALQAFQFET